MFKLKLGFALVLILSVVVIQFMGSHHVVRTKDGWHFIKKEQWTLEKTWIDTTDWTWVDYIKNQEITTTLAHIEWEQIRDNLNKKWRDLQSTIDEEWARLHDQEPPPELNRQWDELKEKAQQTMSTIEREWRNKEIAAEDYQKRVEDLEKWVTKEMDRIKAILKKKS